MNADIRAIPLDGKDALATLLDSFPNPKAPALLLSASVPYLRKPPTNRNIHYLNTARPERIRLAVRALTESALMRGMRLVFGAHPAISPMVLEAAKAIDAPKGSILIFQSEFFRHMLPGSTLELADWSVGNLIFTPARQPLGVSSPSDPRIRDQSLTEMRKLMAAADTLVGAVFIGGMEGTVEEAEIMLNGHGHLPRYALASTGSAAQDLFQRPDLYSGNFQPQDQQLLFEYPVSYKLLARRILDDMGIPPSPALPT